eukprot:COSAG04_NODE_1278_length_7428_cov_25.792332_9_plen_368_part_00
MRSMGRRGQAPNALARQRGAAASQTTPRPQPAASLSPGDQAPAPAASPAPGFAPPATSLPSASSPVSSEPVPPCGLRSCAFAARGWRHRPRGSLIDLRTPPCQASGQQRRIRNTYRRWKQCPTPALPPMFARLAICGAALLQSAAAAPAAPAPVAACKLESRLSESGCGPADFGCNANGTMWVSGGCRGTFTCNDVQDVLCDPCDPGSECKGTSKHAKHVCACAPPPPSPPAPKYMLLDDRNIIATEGSELVFGKVEKKKGAELGGSMIHDGDKDRPCECSSSLCAVFPPSEAQKLLRRRDALRQHAAERVVRPGRAAWAQEVARVVLRLHELLQGQVHRPLLQQPAAEVRHGQHARRLARLGLPLR